MNIHVFLRKELEKTIRRDLPGVLHQAINLSSKQFQHFEKDLISLNWEGFPEEVHPLEVEYFMFELIFVMCFIPNYTSLISYKRGGIITNFPCYCSSYWKLFCDVTDFDLMMCSSLYLG